ncbi:30S ribosomal protein S2 [Kosmotoga arenicorallina S304]|uniref:Small ribosomal subunit protein uS2 n=1 Tax=Kosmotoga arenicorallina S304 TaxID=1453497 RepID=A0A176K292_9BACT|nr:30S ribosomal protein S2 [Kosmotoga arenicorallina]OAA31326.1 30S ribosomal protein S2 [Kosmotoga arenicorallina S304]
MSVISMKQLLEAGVHFGHRTRRWDPRMKPYIYGERKGIFIIDLQKTLKMVEEVYDYVKLRASEGAEFLFVGTKRQAQQIVADEAKRCGAYYVNNRWLGGLLTNFVTIKKRIEVLKQYEEMEETGELDKLPKKEQSVIRKKLDKLRKNLDGVKDMARIPDVIFVVDPKKEEIAVKEANKLGITVIGIADTNANPDVLDYLVPGNDDAIRAIKLITQTIANAILEGREGMNVADEEETVPVNVVEEGSSEEPKTVEEVPAAKEEVPAGEKKDSEEEL